MPDADDSLRVTADGDPRSTVVVLFSAGKDSALAACLLDHFYDVVLCHCQFDVDIEAPVAETANSAAGVLDLPLVTVEFDESIARETVERMVDDGYPRAGVQFVHEHALGTVAARKTLTVDGEGRRFGALADGPRRDDRVPSLDRGFAQSLEDRHDVSYVRPLLGYGRDAVDELVERLLTVETGPSERVTTADYETELRALIAAEYDPETVADVFPDHVQSRVTGSRDS
jgi:predicted subunit of tRNA(5-methylaminomethyl-2-thiouridylate) methyltransferase